MASERPEVSGFFSKLHSSVLKPRGYTRLRRTFQKEHEGYAVAFQFQGSDWNSAGSPWRFYLNAGLRFSDLPRRDMDRDFPTIHSWTRVGVGLSQWAEPHYEILEGDEDLLIGKLAAIIEDSQKYFATNHRTIREKYELKPISFLGYLDETLMKR